jgi:acetoin utilization protein AcuB
MELALRNAEEAAVDFTLEQVMTRSPHTIQAGASAQAAHEMLTQHTIRHLPVEENGKIIGVLSEREVNLALSLTGERTTPVSVFSLCSQPAYLVERSEPIALVLRTMAAHRYGCVLVTEQGRLAGIATATDMLRFMAIWLEREAE